MTVDAAAQTASPSTHLRSARFDDRLLAEATVTVEEANPGIDTNRADAIAAAEPGDLESKIIVRAHHLHFANQLQSALHQVRHWTGMIVLAGVVLALIAGAGAARAALTSLRDEPINFFWAIGAALGVQTIFLFLWIVLCMIGVSRNRRSLPSVSTASIGGILLRVAQSVARRVNNDLHHAAAITAYGKTISVGRLGLWTISSISHGMWLAFNVSCLIAMMVMLSARQYTFAWETTILSERQFVPITMAMSELPRRAGFPVPSEEIIRASQWPHAHSPNAEASQTWSGLLIGSIVVYGFAPRLLLLGFVLGRRRLAVKRFRLDLTRPEFVRLAGRFAQVSKSIGIVDADGDQQSAVRAAHAATSSRPIGPPAIIAFEFPSSHRQSAWPPALHDVRWNDLGAVDHRDDQHRVIQSLTTSPSEPSTLVMIAFLTSTPDRGVATFLRELRQTISSPIALVLTGGESLRKRSNSTDVQQRIVDWHALAAQCGVEAGRVVEVDLDHLTAASAAKFASIIHGDGSTNPREAAGGIDQAFAMIAEQAASWLASPQSPTDSELAELHRRIAQSFQSPSTNWQSLLAARPNFSANVVDQLKSSAVRMTELLPQRLRLNPKWIAAGTLAGAMGCIAAATLVTPVAVGALPMWSIIGGALSVLIASTRSNQSLQQPSPNGGRAAAIANAVRSAALFGIVLELQGRDERMITQILDRVVPQSDADALDRALTPIAVSQWLDEMRHRLQIAVTETLRT